MKKVKIEQAYDSNKKGEKGHGILIIDPESKAEIMLFEEEIFEIIEKWNETKMMLNQKKDKK